MTLAANREQESNKDVTPTNTSLLLSDTELLNQRTELEFQFSAYQRLDLSAKDDVTKTLIADFEDIAAKLVYIYDRLVDKPKMANSVYKKYLSLTGLTTDTPAPQASQPQYLQHVNSKTLPEEEDSAEFTADFRNIYFVVSNFFRLLGLRIKRMFATLDPVGMPGVGKNQGAFLNGFDVFFRYLAIIFYIPRLFLNIGLMIKHVIPGPWMDDEEYQLGWWTRLKHQWDQRWFQIGNDVIWITMGVLTGFVLSTSMGMWGIVLLYAYDVAAMGWKLWQDSAELEQLILEYQQRPEDAALSRKIALLEEEYQNNLSDLRFNFGVTVGLLGGMFCAFGVPLLWTGLIASTLCPIVGMSIVLLTCFTVLIKQYIWPKIQEWLADDEPPKKTSPTNPLPADTKADDDTNTPAPPKTTLRRNNSSLDSADSDEVRQILRLDSRESDLSQQAGSPDRDLSGASSPNAHPHIGASDSHLETAEGGHNAAPRHSAMALHRFSYGGVERSQLPSALQKAPEGDAGLSGEQPLDESLQPRERGLPEAPSAPAISGLANPSVNRPLRVM